MKFNDLPESIGNTPHIRLSRLFPNHEVWIKDERRNPGGSLKDRIARAMIVDAETRGLLRKGSVIVEPTSGNTGIGLALCGAARGYRVILVMPESMSIERRNLLKAYGAELVLTPRERGMRGAIEKASEILKSTEGAWMPMQFENPENPAIHAATTAMEIVADFPEGIDFLVTGVGTGGHISGVSLTLKKHFPSLKVFAVEPSDSPVLSGGTSGPHAIQGIGAGFIPANYSDAYVDKIITVTKEEAFGMARLAASTEGMLAGISTGASLAAVKQMLELAEPGQKIMTFAYDTGERYLSVGELFT